MKNLLFVIATLLLPLSAISQNNATSDIYLYPNTADNFVNLRVDVQVQPVSIDIFDLQGRLIKNIKLKDDLIYSIDTSNMPEGMYSLVLTSLDNTRSKSFIVNHNGLQLKNSAFNERPDVIKKISAKSVAKRSIILEPIEDAYIEGSDRHNSNIMKVYTSWRSSYLKFNLENISGKITKATLSFTIDQDAGSGKIEVFKGKSNNWSEDNLSVTNRPSKSSSPIGTTNGIFGIGKRVSINLEANDLNSSLLSLVMIQPSGMNDFAFVSKEHPTKSGPELLIEYEHEDNTSISDDDDDSKRENIITIEPQDDAYFQDSKSFNTSVMKVYTSYRTSYFKFDLKSIPSNIESATLNFTITSDAGSGKIEVYKGHSSNWTEKNLTTSNRPKKSSNPIASINSTYPIGKRVSIAINPSDLTDSTVSLIMQRPSGTNDFAFASKEHTSIKAPELIISSSSKSDGLTGKGEENKFEYIIDYTNINILLNMHDAIEAANRRAVDEWMKEQEDEFKESINAILETNHSTFNEAQRDFFKNYELKENRINESISNIKSDYYWQVTNNNNEQIPLTTNLYFLQRWEIKNGCKNNSSSADCKDLFDKKVDGITLGNSSDLQLDQLWSFNLKQFSIHEFSSGSFQSKVNGFREIRDKEILLNEVIDKHIKNYRKQGLWDKIFLMTAYLNEYVSPEPPLVYVFQEKYINSQYWDDDLIRKRGLQNASFLPNEIKIFNDINSLKEGSADKKLFDKIVQEHIDDLNT